MSVEANKALVRRFYEEIDKGNLEALDEIVARVYPCAPISDVLLPDLGRSISE